MTNFLRYLAVVAFACLLLLFLAQSDVFAADGGVNGAGKLARKDEVWRDARRERDVPVRIVMPGETSDGKPLPVILFSHGLGGNLEAGKLWAAEWATNGFIVVTVQHAGSDDGVWKDKPPAERLASMKAAATARNLTARVDDIRFALDEVTRRHAVEPLWKQADLKRIGMSGHSFGARTTMGVTGQNLGPISVQPDPRISAAVAFSPLGAARMGTLEQQFANIRMPFFSVTGDADGEVMGDGTKPEDRTRPYQFMPAPDKYLAVFQGGDHMVFGGHNTRNDTDRRIQKDVKALTLAFWNAYLKDNDKAREWLKTGAVKSLQAGDRFSFK
jgi:predicted dienelactone hydrolase